MGTLPKRIFQLQLINSKYIMFLIYQPHLNFHLNFLYNNLELFIINSLIGDKSNMYCGGTRGKLKNVPK